MPVTSAGQGAKRTWCISRMIRQVRGRFEVSPADFGPVAPEKPAAFGPRPRPARAGVSAPGSGGRRVNEHARGRGSAPGERSAIAGRSVLDHDVIPGPAVEEVDAG